MFRRFSLFDSSAPPARISATPPKITIKNKNGRTSIKSAILNSLQTNNTPALLGVPEEKQRSKSLDHSRDRLIIQPPSVSDAAKQRSKSTTLPPVIRQLPQSTVILSNRWYSRLGNSFRRNIFYRRSPTDRTDVILFNFLFHLVSQISLLDFY